jgi:hypothetical protein
MRRPMTSALNRTSTAGRVAALLFAVAIAASGPASALPVEGSQAFIQHGQHYTFTFEFVVSASPDEVLDALYPFPSLQQYSRTASEVELLDQGNDWQRVRFTYTTWLWSMSTTFRREIDRPNHCIRFQMLDAERTGLPVPLPIASSGEYRLDPVDGGVRVTFLQRAETADSLLLRAWMARARSEATLFSRDVESYVRSRLP